MMTATVDESKAMEHGDMHRQRQTGGGVAANDASRSGRLIARIGSASILRGQDGFLHVTGDTPGARHAALAWMVTVNPSMIGRVRRCIK